jgi:hypothetical protein
MDWSRVPLLLITATLLISGVIENGIGGGSQAVLSVGFVCLGCWLSIEVQTWYQKLRHAWERRDDPDGPGV